MLVNDLGQSDMAPCSGFGGACTLDDYSSWRRLAVELRASAMKSGAPGMFEYLEKWGDGEGVKAFVALRTKADPDVDGLRFPKVPGKGTSGPHGFTWDTGAILAMGGAKVFTDRVPALVQYCREGDALVPEGKGTRAVELARKRQAGRPAEPSRFGDAVIAVGATVAGGLIVWAITSIVGKVKRD